MGLLDDAIREHLDLKRRRGADPSEVERAEREALGPVRRGPEPGDDEELDLAGEGAAAEPGVASEPLLEDDLGWEEPAVESEAPEPDRAATQPQVPFDAEAEAPPGSTRRASDESIAPDPLAEETAEFNVEEDLDSGAKEKKDDPLEETPEFLQDTPDHDRLWFEQKPPRNFDFDK